MDSVIGPKVRGAIHLDHATSGEDLDFFVLFSSVAGMFGNAGQCDYAYANRFLDGFAAGREELRTMQKRRGRTLSIGWPYWSDGGMRLAADELADIEHRTGLAGVRVSLRGRV